MPFPHSFLCGSCLWCWWWYRSPPWCPQNNGEPGEPPRSSQCLPIHHHLGTHLSLGTRELRRNVPWKGGPAPIPTSQAPGVRPPDSASTAPFSSYHFHVLNTWVNRTAGWSLAWQSPLQLSLPLILGTKRGFLRRGGWPAHIHTNPLNFKE